MEAEIHEFGTASLHLDARVKILDKEDEISREYCSESDSKLISSHEVDAPGQVVPSQESKTNGCQSWETGESRDIGHLSVFIVPQAGLEPIGNVEESSRESMVNGIGSTTSSTSSLNISCKTNKQGKLMKPESYSKRFSSTAEEREFRKTILQHDNCCQYFLAECIGKTFVWPAIGFKDQITKQTLSTGQTSNLGTVLNCS